MLSHLARDVGGDDMSVLQLNPENSVRQGLNNRAIHLDNVFFSHFVDSLEMLFSSKCLGDCARTILSEAFVARPSKVVAQAGAVRRGGRDNHARPA
jgi:hypothetical protein